MNRNQRIALVVALANLVLICLFPPVDHFSVASSSLPVFAGFYFLLDMPPLGMINADFLAIEVMVVLANLAIAWLLLCDKPAGGSRRGLSLQNAALVFTAGNLMLLLLFPPMESVFAVTKAAIPTFEGFYFVFAKKPAHVIVETLLYIEITLILVNSALLWLIFRERNPPSADEIRAAMREYSLR
ncbi:MAG: hypothetical protein ACK59Y_09900 [Betaproteobacteria bacterium]|jgi:hypothetical protein|nr:hypothetical protein [Betaproteobacteria bacterium]